MKDQRIRCCTSDLRLPLVVNISSGAALKGYAGWSPYRAAKAALEGFIRALAMEEEHQQFFFEAISVDPGVIDTGMQALIRATPSADFPEVERFARRKRDGGLAAPDTVAAAIIQLISGPALESGARFDTPTDP